MFESFLALWVVISGLYAIKNYKQITKWQIDRDDRLWKAIFYDPDRVDKPVSKSRYMRNEAGILLISAVIIFLGSGIIVGNITNLDGNLGGILAFIISVFLFLGMFYRQYYLPIAMSKIYQVNDLLYRKTGKKFTISGLEFLAILFIMGIAVYLAISLS